MYQSLNQGLHENVDFPALVYALQTSLKSVVFLPLPVMTKSSPASNRDARYDGARYTTSIMKTACFN